MGITLSKLIRLIGGYSKKGIDILIRPAFSGKARSGEAREVNIMANGSKGNENMLGAVAYLLGFITGVVLLLVEKKSKFVRFHAMQSTILFGGLFVVNIALGFIPLLGWAVGFLLSLVAFVLWIFLMWKAFSGEMYKLPYVGELAEKQLSKL